MMDLNKAIGVFDSGVGGLTVVKQLRKILLNENIIYLGDTARVPYGNKSHKVIEQYALEDASFLVKQNVKAIVIACNTASAHGVEVIKKKFPKIPIFEMIESGSRYAIGKTKNKRIGVIGTSATINSGHYLNKIIAYDKDCDVISKACPLFVPLVEEGFIKTEITKATILHYLKDLKDYSIDTLILGCTHYPMLRDEIQEYFGPDVYLIDSGKAAANFVKERLMNLDIINKEKTLGHLALNLTCHTPGFKAISNLILGEEIKKINIVNIETVVNK
jgi:glutamate racemase